MQIHLQMRSEEYERQGLTTDDARRAASRRFGNLALMQDRGYDVRGGGVMETVLQDVRYGVRLLLRHRAFSMAAILTLAMGIGVSTALFSVIDAALLRPLPYPHPEQLVEALVSATHDGKSSRYSPSMADIRAWRDAAWPVLLGLSAGMAVGLYATRVVQSFLFETTPHDPATFAARRRASREQCYRPASDVVVIRFGAVGFALRCLRCSSICSRGTPFVIQSGAGAPIR